MRVKLTKAGGTAWQDAEPPSEVEDSPKQITLKALALDPIDIIIGVLRHDGTIRVLSTFSDEFMELGALKKMEQIVSAPSDEDGA
jgi:hypothetical protein